MVKKRIGDILLENQRFVFVVFDAGQSLLDFLKFVGALNALTSVGELAWLDDPVIGVV